MRGGLFSFQRLSVQLSLHQHRVMLLHRTGRLQMVASIRFSHQLMRHDDYFLFAVVIVKTSQTCWWDHFHLGRILEGRKPERDSPGWSIQLITCDLAQSAESHWDSRMFSGPAVQLAWSNELSSQRPHLSCDKFPIYFSQNFASELKKSFGWEVEASSKAEESSGPNSTLLL